ITVLVFFASLSSLFLEIALDPLGLLDVAARYVIGPIVTEMILVVFLSLTILSIINEAKTRTLKFTIEIEKKLHEYNKKLNNVHYKLKWRKGFFTRYDVEMGCRVDNNE